MELVALGKKKKKLYFPEYDFLLMEDSKLVCKLMAEREKRVLKLIKSEKKTR